MAFEVNLLKSAREHVEARCAKVGLALESLKGLPSVSSQASFWASSYACVLLWPVETESTLLSEAHRAEGVFNEMLGVREKPRGNRPIDGYLVLLLSAAPSGEVDDAVRDLELSSQICRKHVVWPLAEVEQGRAIWSRLEAVTVLGLPDAQTPSIDVAWPKLEGPADELWQELDGKSPINVARRHGAQQ